jgi:hypothetical protein
VLTQPWISIGNQLACGAQCITDEVNGKLAVTLQMGNCNGPQCIAEVGSWAVYRYTPSRTPRPPRTLGQSGPPVATAVKTNSAAVDRGAFKIGDCFVARTFSGQPNASSYYSPESPPQCVTAQTSVGTQLVRYPAKISGWRVTENCPSDGGGSFDSPHGEVGTRLMPKCGPGAIEKISVDAQFGIPPQSVPVSIRMVLPSGTECVDVIRPLSYPSVYTGGGKSGYTLQRTLGQSLNFVRHGDEVTVNLDDLLKSNLGATLTGFGTAVNIGPTSRSATPCISRLKASQEQSAQPYLLVEQVKSPSWTTPAVQ